jgi:glycosyltransferase involved in cell wall biosynthesis
VSPSEPLVTVVTPFYNTEAYLAECIESVLCQTYDNWEYVLVNNQSTDGSVDIAEHYVRLYPEKLRLEHTCEFLSQVQNYNGALSRIAPASKYCKLVQADDWIFPECLASMVAAAERDPSIAVVGSYSIEGRDVAFGGLPYSTSMLDGNDVCRMFFIEDRYLFGSPTQLLLRSDVVLQRRPFYDESDIPFEDATVVFELLTKHNFAFVHQVLTFSRRDNSSVMKELLQLDSPLAFQLLMHHKFGHLYLRPAEYRRELHRKQRAYCQLLVDGLVGLREKPFWQFHGAMLKRMRYRITSTDMWWPLLRAVSDILLNPKRSLGLVRRGLDRRLELRRARRGPGKQPGSAASECAPAQCRSPRAL